jgi:hypothetical protein
MPNVNICDKKILELYAKHDNYMSLAKLLDSLIDYKKFDLFDYDCPNCCLGDDFDFSIPTPISTTTTNNPTTTTTFLPITTTTTFIPITTTTTYF